MKKMILICALVCAGHMYGMEPTSPVPYEASGEVWVEELRRTGPLEPQEPMGYFAQLPKELHQEIIMALFKSKDLRQVVEAVEVACALQGACYDNLKDFTKLVHVLAKKFRKTTDEIALNFKTRLAAKYRHLGQQLVVRIIGQLPFDKAVQLINSGADVNFSMVIQGTPLLAAIRGSEIDVVKLLIQSGAIPTNEHLEEAKIKVMWQPSNQKAAEIVQIIENALQKK